MQDPLLVGVSQPLPLPQAPSPALLHEGLSFLGLQIRQRLTLQLAAALNNGEI